MDKQFGTYGYSLMDIKTRLLIEYKMPVEILKESETQYQIKFLEFRADNKKVPGYTTWVHKEKVTIKEALPQ